MPAENLEFRRRCGVFIFIFNYFMFKRAKSKQRKPGLRFKTRLDGVLFGMTLSFLTWGVLLLRQCGDVELNPGPPIPGPPGPPGPSATPGSSRTLRQQTLNARHLSSSPTRSQSDSSSSTPSREPTIADVMARLSTLESLDKKVDQLVGDVKFLRDSCLTLQNDVKDIRNECDNLREENIELRNQNTRLEKRMEAMEKKTDDLECRSKRNNILIHGFHRREGETAQELVDNVREFFTDKLELGKAIPFDRLHRLNSKPTSPVIGCCSSFRDKLQVMKAKGKLRGTDVYIGEDFSLRVREIRRRLTPHLKNARDQNRRVRMVFDHLVIEGKKFTVDSEERLV